MFVAWFLINFPALNVPYALFCLSCLPEYMLTTFARSCFLKNSDDNEAYI